MFRICVGSALMAVGCISSVPASNPYDPDVPIEQQQRSTFDGIVVSRSTDAAVAGAELFLDGPTAPEVNPFVSPADGTFNFGELIPGSYTLDVIHPAHLPRSYGLSFAAGQHRALEVLLDPVPSSGPDSGHLSGTVLRESEAALDPTVQDHSGIVVEIAGTNIRTFTNLAGRFDLDLLPGTYDVAFSTVDHLARTETADVIAGATTDMPPLTLLANPGQLSGTVYLEGSDPMQPLHADTLVSLLGVSGTATTAADGTFRFNSVAPGTYTLRAIRTGFDTVEVQNVTVRGGVESTTATLILPIARGGVSGQVELVGKADGIYSGVAVGLQGTVYSSTTNADGAFLMLGVPVGPYTVVAARDGYGTEQRMVNITSGATAGVGLISMIRQVGDFTINNGAEYTNDPTVTLNLSPPMNNDEYSVYGDVDMPSGWVPYNPMAIVMADLTSAMDGDKTVRVKYRNSGTMVETAEFTATIGLDRQEPQWVVGEPPVLINGGAPFTNSALVSLTFKVVDSFSGVSHVQVSSDGMFDTELWDTRILGLLYDLDPLMTGTQGTKTVYVRFQDRATNPTVVDPLTTVSVTLDTSIPNVDTFTVSCPNPNSQAGFCNSGLVTLSISASDNLDPSGESSLMAVANEEGFTFEDWEPYLNARGWILSPGDGMKTVNVKTMDAAGNESNERSAMLELDTTPPAGVQVVITGADANGASSSLTGSSTVDLTLSATDTNLNALYLSNDNNFTMAVPQTVGAVMGWPLAPGDGLRTVYLRAIDDGGNVTDTSSSIVVDVTRPSITGVTIIGRNVDGTPNTTTTAQSTVTLQLTGAGAATVAVRTSAVTNCDMVAPAAYDTAFAPSIPFDLGGVNEVWVCVRDAAGNTSGMQVGNDDIVLDTTPPSCTLTLAGYMADGTTTAPANQTAVTSIDVTSTCTGAPTGMAIVPSTQSIDCATAAYDSYAATSSVVVPPGDGPKNVNACYRDSVGNTSGPVSAAVAISLDQTPPTGVTLTVVRDGDPIDQPVSAIDDVDVDLFLDANGADEMRWENDPASLVSASYVGFSTAAQNWQLIDIAAGTECNVPEARVRTVYGQLRDALGNAAAVATYSLALDKCAPAQPTVGVVEPPDADSGFVRSFDVTVTVGGAGLANATRMTIGDRNSWSAGCPAASFEAYGVAGAAVKTLSNADGQKRVCVRLFDDAGNQSVTGTASLTVDTTPPGPPTVTPSNVAQANTSCADIVPSGSVDINFWFWQYRNNGQAWQDLPMTWMAGNPINFGLAQDTTNLLEIRAVDRAGNPGNGSIAVVEEVSSYFVATPHTVTRVCDNGKYLIVEDEESRIFRKDGFSDNIYLGPLPEIYLYDVEGRALLRLDGPAGLVSIIANSGAGGAGAEPEMIQVVSAACEIESDDLVVIYHHRIVSNVVYNRMFLWAEPIADPAEGLTWLNGGNDFPSGNRGPVRLDAVDIAGSTVDAVGIDFWRSPAIGGPPFYERYDVAHWSIDDTSATIGATEDFFQTAKSSQYQFRGLAKNGAAFYYLHATDIYYTTSSATPAIVLTNSADVWGVHVKPASFWHGASGTTREFGLYVFDGGSAWELEYIDAPAQASALLGSSTADIPGSSPALPPGFFDYAEDAIAWVDQDTGRGFRLDNNYGGSNTRQFASVIDQARPIWSLRRRSGGNPVPGEPLVVYHAQQLSEAGFVVGYENEVACVQ